MHSPWYNTRSSAAFVSEFKLSFSAYFPLSQHTSLHTVALDAERSTIICFLLMKHHTFKKCFFYAEFEPDHCLISCSCTYVPSHVPPSFLPCVLCTLPLPLANSNSPFSLFLLHMQPQEHTDHTNATEPCQTQRLQLLPRPLSQHPVWPSRQI